jgi:quinol monooxygenase YgiN
VLPTRIEEGCITYQLYQNEADPTDFAFIEEWTSDEDLAALFSSDHFKNASERGAELVRGTTGYSPIHIRGLAEYI